MALVYNLSVERGTTRGVEFRPVLRDGCWVGEGETTDPDALAFFATRPQTYVIVYREEPFVGLDPILRPEDMAQIEGAAMGTLQVSQGFELLPEAEMTVVEGFQTVLAAPTEPLSATVNIVPNTAKVVRPSEMWPEDLDPAIVEILVAAGWTPVDVESASDAQLEAIKGIGPVSVKKIRAAFALVLS